MQDQFAFKKTQQNKHQTSELMGEKNSLVFFHFVCEILILSWLKSMGEMMRIDS